MPQPSEKLRIFPCIRTCQSAPERENRKLKYPAVCGIKKRSHFESEERVCSGSCTRKNATKTTKRPDRTDICWCHEYVTKVVRSHTRNARRAKAWRRKCMSFEYYTATISLSSRAKCPHQSFLGVEHVRSECLAKFSLAHPAQHTGKNDVIKKGRTLDPSTVQKVR